MCVMQMARRTQQRNLEDEESRRCILVADSNHRIRLSKTTWEGEEYLEITIQEFLVI